MTARRVLVTGGAGFIARELIRRLSQEKALSVVAISRRPSDSGNAIVEKVDLCDADEVRNWSSDQLAIGGLDGIFHLAAQVPARFDGEDAEASRLTNLRMTEQVLSLAKIHHCPVIYASSTSVYGTGLTAPTDEAVPPNPNNGYSEGKLAGEDLLARAHEDLGIVTASLRIAAPYGPEQRLRNVITIFIDAALNGKEIAVQGTGNRTQDFTFVSDVAEAFWLAFQQGAVGAFNVSGGKPSTMLELARQVVNGVANTASRIQVGNAPDAQDNYRGIFPIDKARREFGFEPRVSLEAGLSLCIAARRSQNAT